MFNWLVKIKEIKERKQSIEDRWNELSFIYDKIDTETMGNHHRDKKNNYEKLNQKIRELRTNVPKNLKTELDYKSYYSLQWDLFKETLDSNLIYQYDNKIWTFESPYQTLQKFDQSQFGPVHCTHLMYPSEKGVGGTKGYFIFLEYSDGESYSIDFVKPLSGEKFKNHTVFSFTPYKVVNKEIQLQMTKFCLENKLPTMGYDLWDIIMLGIGSHTELIKKVSYLHFDLTLLKHNFFNRWEGR